MGRVGLPNAMSMPRYPLSRDGFAEVSTCLHRWLISVSARRIEFWEGVRGWAYLSARAAKFSAAVPIFKALRFAAFLSHLVQCLFDFEIRDEVLAATSPRGSLIEWNARVWPGLVAGVQVSSVQDAGVRRYASMLLCMPMRRLDLAVSSSGCSAHKQLRVRAPFLHRPQCRSFPHVRDARPSEPRFPSTTPDLVGVGHVGKFSFEYSLLSAEVACVCAVRLSGTVIFVCLATSLLQPPSPLSEVSPPGHASILGFFQIL